MNDKRVENAMYGADGMDGVREEFEAAGGMDIYKPEHLQELIHKVSNGPLWDKAKKQSEAEYGTIRWPFVMFLYEKMGGNT